MELQHIGAKIYAKNPVDLAKAIPVFHSWIQNNVTDDILIDVADYRHVPAGPGVVLVGHHGNFAIDLGPENRPGVLFIQKTKRDGQNKDRILHSLKRAFDACRRLESDASLGAAFGGTEILLVINDRLLAPNTDESLQSVKKDVEEALKVVLGAKKFVVERISGDPRERLTLRISCDEFNTGTYAA